MEKNINKFNPLFVMILLFELNKVLIFFNSFDIKDKKRSFLDTSK